ncbi:MAG: hypothetical protein H6Q15_2226 [Bacteroidetes bacterium]|nr:hypothetical protein [Bacteroidota bacterium]
MGRKMFRPYGVVFQRKMTFSKMGTIFDEFHSVGAKHLSPHNKIMIIINGTKLSMGRKMFRPYMGGFPKIKT